MWCIPRAGSGFKLCLFMSVEPQAAIPPAETLSSSKPGGNNRSTLVPLVPPILENGGYFASGTFIQFLAIVAVLLLITIFFLGLTEF